MTFLRFLLRRATAMTALMAVIALVAACSTPSDSGGAATDDSGNAAGGTVSVTDGTVELSAEALAFDANVIQATAGEAFTITFTNNDSVPHNVSIYTEEGGEEIVTGEVIDGGASTEVQVDALDASEYYFLCDLHPEMNGAVVVAEG